MTVLKPKICPCPLLVNMVRAGKLGVKSKKVSTIILKASREKQRESSKKITEDKIDRSSQHFNQNFNYH
jgi:3-hydroxyacyl-CoA dehydrogenase